MRKFLLAALFSAFCLVTFSACAPKYVNDDEVKAVADGLVYMLTTAGKSGDNCEDFANNVNQYFDTNGAKIERGVKNVVADDEKMKSALYVIGLTDPDTAPFEKIVDLCKDRDDMQKVLNRYTELYENSGFNKASEKFR